MKILPGKRLLGFCLLALSGLQMAAQSGVGIDARFNNQPLALPHVIELLLYDELTYKRIGEVPIVDGRFVPPPNLPENVMVKLTLAGRRFEQSDLRRKDFAAPFWYLQIGVNSRPSDFSRLRSEYGKDIVEAWYFDGVGVLTITPIFKNEVLLSAEVNGGLVFMNAIGFFDRTGKKIIESPVTYRSFVLPDKELKGLDDVEVRLSTATGQLYAFSGIPQRALRPGQWEFGVDGIAATKPDEDTPATGKNNTKTPVELLSADFYTPQEQIRIVRLPRKGK